MRRLVLVTITDALREPTSQESCCSLTGNLHFCFCQSSCHPRQHGVKVEVWRLPQLLDCHNINYCSGTGEQRKRISKCWCDVHRLHKSRRQMWPMIFCGKWAQDFENFIWVFWYHHTLLNSYGEQTSVAGITFDTTESFILEYCLGCLVFLHAKYINAYSSYVILTAM